MKKKILAAAALLTVLFLFYDGWFLFSRSFAKKQRVTPSGEGFFSISLKPVFYPYVVREGMLIVVSSERLSGIEAAVFSAAPDSAVKRKDRFRTVSPRRFEIPAAADLADWTLQLTPARPDIKTIDVSIMLQPTFQPAAYFPKAAFIFSVILTILAASVLAFHWILDRPGPRDDLLRLIIVGILGTVAAAAVFAVLHPGLFCGFAVRLGARPARWLLINAIFGAALAAVYWIFRKFRLSLYYWPLLLSFAGLLVFPAYNIPVCGDSWQWLSVLKLKRLNLFAAEFLSFPLNRAVLKIGRLIAPSFSPPLAQVMTGKIVGMLTLFVLTIFISGETRLSRERKLLFLVLASTFGFQAYFLGYPEFGFYPLPFLLAAAISARRYLRPDGGRICDLVGTAFWVAVAGLFHGSAWIVLPAVFLLPPLRKRRETEQPIAAFDRIKSWALAGLAWAAVAAAAFGLARALGFKISFQNAAGGGDKGMFVSMFAGGPAETSGVLAFELRYLWERAWALFLAFPLPLFPAAAASFRHLRDEAVDRFWLAAGLFSLVIFLFWNFDLGYADFDLYTIPLTLPALYLLKGFLTTAGRRLTPIRETALVLLFALASPVFLILQLTTISGF